MSDCIYITEARPCDICRGADAVVDGKTTFGPWAHMCEACWSAHGVGRLGTGYGQRLVVRPAVAR